MSADIDVAIVGGGAAGIGAARRLAQAGLSAVLLEASARLGGRAWTHQIAGLPLDLGCGWFHSADRNAWVGIAEAAGIAIERSTPAWGVQFRDLGFPKAEQASARRAFADWMQRLGAAAPPSDRAADALDPASEWNSYIRAIVGFISGARLEQLSIADYLAYDNASTDSNWRTPSGFGSLLARSFPQNLQLRLSTPATSIYLDADAVTVGTASGEVRARTAILTVSTAVLAGDTLALASELAPWREAASLLPLGRNEKLFLEIDGSGPFAPETQVLGNPREASTASYYIRPFGWPVIECFFGGEGVELVERGGPVAGFEHAIEQLCALFGADVRRTVRPLAASSWSRMTHIGGAYSYAQPGHAAARVALARPFEDRVFFAGEATSRDNFSTAHGAHDSGVRAAEEVITVLKRRESRLV
jgi:monoamine oxidase